MSASKLEKKIWNLEMRLRQDMGLHSVCLKCWMSPDSCAYPWIRVQSQRVSVCLEEFQKELTEVFAKLDYLEAQVMTSNPENLKGLDSFNV